ncbi:hypothetical protein [Thalassospira sp.]|uniref:hypothetical protein n=1 Tax=Thalassospira sp. TaxID=1912094 RepID=UPI0032F039D1
MKTNGVFFLRRRASQEIIEPETASPSSFACLYDAEHCGESRLSELLTLYDRVDILPERNHLGWTSKHQVPLKDLQELIRLKRVRVILPYSANDYPSSLIESAFEADSSSVVLSRSLATRTIIRGQKKEPFLYAPLTSSQRAAILFAMHKVTKDDKHRGLVKSYGDLFIRQHDTFMMRGALASFGYGVGTYLGDVFLKLLNRDARLELAICGAGIEWALALGASYIPRNFGGFDETGNSQIIASFLGGTKAIPADPVANRIHTVTDGLLSVSGISPLEVVKNFHSLPAVRFRNVAKKLMSSSADEEALRDAISKINADVRLFERRSERLRRWNVGALVGGGAGALITSGVPYGGFASVAAKWAYDLFLNDKIPTDVRGELEDALSMIAGLATGASLDAVVVSRSRKKIAG